MEQLILNSAVINPGKSLHLTYPHHRYPVQAEASVIDRHDLEAKAVWDDEGWIVIVLTNVVDVPVKISPDEPVTVVITPQRRNTSEEIEAIRDQAEAEGWAGRKKRRESRR